MAEERSELRKREVVRLPNRESNRLTRECIQTALILLGGEKDFDKITISELVKRAGVSRTAFYNNFSSKEDVLDDLSHELFRRINEQMQRAVFREHPYELYQRLFEVVRQDSAKFALLLNVGTHKRSVMDIAACIDRVYPDMDVQTRYLALGWWGGVQNIIVDWYQRGMKESIASMAELCCKFSDEILQQAQAADPDIIEKWNSRI